MIFQSNYDVNNVFFRIIGGVVDYCVIALNVPSVRCGFFCTFANMKNKETRISVSFHVPSLQGYMRMNMMFSDIIAVL